jgi:hypothetical protein
MVRLVGDTVPGEPDELVDRKLEEFAGIVIPRFASYIPN